MRNNMTDKTEGKYIRILKNWQNMKEETEWKKEGKKESMKKRSKIRKLWWLWGWDGSTHITFLLGYFQNIVIYL